MKVNIRYIESNFYITYFLLEFVRLICLPFGNTDKETSNKVVVAGWGYTIPGVKGQSQNGNSCFSNLSFSFKSLIFYNINSKFL